MSDALRCRGKGRWEVGLRCHATSRSGERGLAVLARRALTATVRPQQRRHPA